MIIAYLLLNFLQQTFENRLVNKVFMIGCMTCPWAPTAGGTTAQIDQRNDGAMAPNTQQLHHRLGHINRTLQATNIGWKEIVIPRRHVRGPGQSPGKIIFTPPLRIF